jgi:DNA-binding response OmpR family regulator
MEKKKIMIVEDEMVVAEDIRSCLEQSGYAVAASVGSGEEAVAAAKKISFDLVLMDVCLAGAMDGVETAIAITGMADVPIVYLSAHADEAILERAKLSDPFGYLVKPFERRGLKSTIEMALHKHSRLTTTGATQAENNGVAGCIDLGFGFYYALEDERLLYFGKEINLTKKEHAFIRLLVENLDQTVSYEKIKTRIWGGSAVDQNNIRIFLWRLRSKIGKELVKNTPGIGYRIERPAAGSS